MRLKVWDNVLGAWQYAGAVPVGVWTDIIPLVTQGATPTFTTNYAAWTKQGRIARYQGQVVITGTGGTAGNPVVVALPFLLRASAVGSVRAFGTGVLFDSSASSYYRMIASPVSTSTMQFMATSSVAAQYIGAIDFTAALATSDQLSWDVTYESAS